MYVCCKQQPVRERGRPREPQSTRDGGGGPARGADTAQHSTTLTAGSSWDTASMTSGPTSSWGAANTWWAAQHGRRRGTGGQGQAGRGGPGEEPSAPGACPRPNPCSLASWYAPRAAPPARWPDSLASCAARNPRPAQAHLLRHAVPAAGGRRCRRKPRPGLRARRRRQRRRQRRCAGRAHPAGYRQQRAAACCCCCCGARRCCSTCQLACGNAGRWNTMSALV